MAQCQVVAVACLKDNYAYLVHDRASGTTLLVDAPEALPIVTELKARDWSLDAILITHHHSDHIGAIEAIAGRDHPRIVGSIADRHRLPALDDALAEGDRLRIGPFEVTAMLTPGHTSGHLCYHFPAEKLVFTADTLFSLGCGRLFEGRPADMWMSLMRLKALPAETAVYPGHEYTQANGRFAVTIDPDNASLGDRLAEVERLRADGRPTVPTTIALERATNPFLRADDPALAQRLGLAGRPPVEVFAEMRRRKDRF